MKKLLFAVCIVRGVCAANGEPPARDAALAQYSRLYVLVGQRGRDMGSASAILEEARRIVEPLIASALVQFNDQSIEQQILTRVAMDQLASILESILNNNGDLANLQVVQAVRRLQLQAHNLATRPVIMIVPPQPDSGSPRAVTEPLRR